MKDKDQIAEHLAKSLRALIKGQRSNRSLYGAVMIIGSVLAIGLFLSSRLLHEGATMLDLAKNLVPLVPSTVCVPQFGICVSKIAQYEAIGELARHDPDAAMRVLEQLLSK